MEELSFIPSAVGEPRSALHMCDDQMQRRGLQVLPTCGHCDRRRRSSSYDQLVQAMLQCDAAETIGAKSDGLKGDD